MLVTGASTTIIACTGQLRVHLTRTAGLANFVRTRHTRVMKDIIGPKLTLMRSSSVTHWTTWTLTPDDEATGMTLAWARTRRTASSNLMQA